VLDTTVPTCGLTDRIGDIRERLKGDEREICVVVNQARVVLGVLRKKSLAADVSATAEQVMYDGPSTFRPNQTLEEMLKFMRERNLKGHSLITAPDGRLLGIIARNDLEATLAHDSP
jgi:Mg/Co/Ni transporter MgtE